MYTFREHFLLEEQMDARTLWEYLKTIVPRFQKEFQHLRGEVQKIGDRPTQEQLMALGQKVDQNKLLSLMTTQQGTNESLLIERYGVKTAFLLVGRILLTFFGIAGAQAAGINLPPILIAGIIIYTIYTTFLTVQGWTKFLFWLKKRKDKASKTKVQQKTSAVVPKTKVPANTPEKVNQARPNNGGQ